MQKNIGQGNFGVVYLGEQAFFDEPVRRVAIKVCKHPDITPETARKLFRDAFMLAKVMDKMTDTEARSHLVHVYDMGLAPELGNRGYLVMEYIEGTTLYRQFSSPT